jgi:hypothetical protein
MGSIPRAESIPPIRRNESKRQLAVHAEQPGVLEAAKVAGLPGNRQIGKLLCSRRF